MRVFLATILILFSGPAFAGGDFVIGRITNFSESAGSLSFRFEQTDRASDLMKGCRSFEVRMQYERVPWYAWLPFVHSAHPTREQTEEALKYLLTSFQNSYNVSFGYMGYGLSHTEESCVFESKGLQLDSFDSEGAMVVLSFYNEI